jgi:hypothetical protein
MTKKEKNIILDPFSCLVKLSLLKYLPEGTKISIYDNKVYFNEPSTMQGVIRFMYGDGREDLHNLFQPIRKCAKWFWNNNNAEIRYLFGNAVAGIKQLKNAYTSWATIQHTLDYYILILIQNDIKFLRTYITSVEYNPSILDAVKASSATADDDDDDISSSSDGDADDDENAMAATTISAEPRNMNPLTSIIGRSSSTTDANPNAPQQNTDIHKYLKTLWTEREKLIIINLFHELDTKKDATEQKYIFTNVMQYCTMKENNLNKYIEDNSHFLT